jgi:hypothetical protein
MKILTAATDSYLQTLVSTLADDELFSVSTQGGQPFIVIMFL